MTPPGPGQHARRGLLSLFVLLVIVELAPIILFCKADALWLLNNAEDFDFLFWPPLKVAFTPSHFFFHVGAVSWAIMKPVHALTAALTGSPHASLEYMQTFGYLVRGLYAALMLAVPLVYWWRRRDALVVALLITLVLALHLATPFMFRLYHLRLGTQLTNKFFILLTATLTLDALRAFLRGDIFTRRRLLAAAIFSGFLFVEVPSYIVFYLPIVLFSLGQMRGAVDTLRCCGLWLAGGAIGFFAGLFLFYTTDWESGSSAIMSMIKGLVSGFPQYQPGFREHFLENLFDIRDNYFWVHVALAVHAGLMLVFAAVTAVAWRFLDRPVRYAAISVGVAFAVVWFIHTRIWATRGSYTSVFSLVYYGFFSLLLAFILLRAMARQLAHRSWRHQGCNIASATTLLAVAALCLVTPIVYKFRNALIMHSATAASFRSFNAVIDTLPKPISLKLNGLPDAPFLLAGHYALAGFFLHVGEAGWNGEDARYSAKIRAQRFPDYHLLHPVRAKAIGYDYRNWTLYADIEPGWPVMPRTVIIAPVPTLLTEPEVDALAQTARLIAPSDLPRDQPLAQYLKDNAQGGLIWDGPKNFPWARWLMVPLPAGETRKALLAAVWPPYWDTKKHRFYFIRTYMGQLLLALPSDEATSMADREPSTEEASPAVETPQAKIQASHGPLKLRLRFPVNKWSQAEPLVTTGREGAGDIIYVVYTDPGHIRIGFDHWLAGGPLSPPIPLDYSQEHQIEISLGSLFPRSKTRHGPGYPAQGSISSRTHSW